MYAPEVERAQPCDADAATQRRTRGVLVVIPTLNEAQTIEDIVHQLRDHLPPDVPLRMVVCDGGSTDATPDIVRRLTDQVPRLHLLHNPKRLQSAAINLAVREYGADADVLVRCDAHAVYPVGYIASLAASLERHDCDAVVVAMDAWGDTCLARAIAWVSDSIVGSGGSAHRGGRRSGFVDHGHHAAFRMSRFVQVGGYDEAFSHNEDAEFDCRQLAMGSRIYLDSDIRLTYCPRGTFAGLWQQYFNYGLGRSRTVRKHPHSWRLRQLAVPTNALVSLVGLAGAPWWHWTLVWPLAYLGALSATSLILAVHRRSLCGLFSGPAALVMHSAWAAGFFTGLLVVNERRWDAGDSEALPLRPGSMPSEGR